MSKNVIEFYTNVANSVGLVVDEGGFVKSPTSKKDLMVMVDKKPLVLPTKEQIATMVETIDGEVTLTKTLFNPLKEDIVKGDSPSLRKLKSIVDIKLSFTTAAVFELLLNLGENLDLQKKASLDLNSFIATLKAARGPNVKNTIDPRTIENWGKINENLLKSAASKGLLHIFLKKGGMHNDTKYNRLAVLGFPAYKQLCEHNAKEPFHGVKLRKKDIEVFKLIYEYVFAGIDSPEQYMIGSNDGTSPGFIALMKMYINIASRLNELLSALTFVDEDTAKTMVLNIAISHNDLDTTSKFAGELAVIPNDNDANRANNRLLGNQVQTSTAAVVQEQNQAPTGKADALSILNKINQPHVAPVQNLPTGPAVTTPVQVDTSNMTAAQKILYGSNPPVNAGMTGPGMIRPMGVNNAGAYNQPAMPMYNNTMPMVQTDPYGNPINNGYNMQPRPMGLPMQ